MHRSDTQTEELTQIIGGKFMCVCLIFFGIISIITLVFLQGISRD